jgi:Tfp pilus assembly protein PilV
MIHRQTAKSRRRGGTYIAVLGTAMIIALLGLAALIGQRIQNRMVVASVDIRQAQLNANAAAELALLTMKQDTSWRSTYTNGDWYTRRAMTFGSTTVNVTDPIDANLANNADDPIAVLGIGYSGQAEQRVKVTIDPRKNPLSCLRSAIAAGNLIDMQGDTLRTNGLITANQISAATSQIYGKVEAVSVSGATYNSTTTVVTSDKRPTMPDWTSAFNYYKTNGTEILVGNLASTPSDMARNGGIESGSTDWTGSPPGTSTATIAQSSTQKNSGANSLRVTARTAWSAGAAQTIDTYVKPTQQYTVSSYVYWTGTLGQSKNFRLSMVTKGVSGTAQQDNGVDVSVPALFWRQVSATLTAQSWSGNLEYAFVKIAGGSDATNTSDFYFDDFTIRETTSGKFIYKKVISPSLNPFGTGVTNSEGIYWINCLGNKVVIERSRILGTLLLINPGAGSCVANGPISWSPAVAGYPALLVDADNTGTPNFAIYASNRGLSEKEMAFNYNPVGAPHEEFGQDTDTNDIYVSRIRGLVAVRNDLTFQNRGLIRGQLLVGHDISNSSGELEIDYQPDSLLNPPPGFTAPYSYFRRPISVQKAVLP